jgi:16S rRNA (adenine1518-N6/adenine1519-N6)-dimethyltransferase
VAKLQATAPENCRIVLGDALEIDWHAHLPHRAEEGSYKVVGNIPYSITTPLIDKALAEPLPSVITFLMQKEVGERLEAAPGSKTYGALSVGVQSVVSVERLFAVRPGSFRPPPKVDSVVVRLKPLAKPLTVSGERGPFRRFVTGLFGQRRKQLARALRTVTGKATADISRVLDELGLDRETRAEVLTPEDFVDLFRFMSR